MVPAEVKESSLTVPAKVEELLLLTVLAEVEVEESLSLMVLAEVEESLSSTDLESNVLKLFATRQFRLFVFS